MHVLHAAHLYTPPQLLYELLVNVLHPLRVLLVQRTKHAGESVQTGRERNSAEKCTYYSFLNLYVDRHTITDNNPRLLIHL